MRRRGFLASIGAVLGAQITPSAYDMPSWTLDDLQICADIIDQKWGGFTNSITGSMVAIEHYKFLTNWENWIAKPDNPKISIHVNESFADDILLLHSNRVLYAGPLSFLCHIPTRTVRLHSLFSPFLSCEG